MQNRTNTNRAADIVKSLKAIASPQRLTILELLKRPSENFLPQVDGDLIKDGVCAGFIRDKLGVSAATASRHLTLLVDAGFLIPKRQRGWTFYRRNERALKLFAAKLKVSV